MVRASKIAQNRIFPEWGFRCTALPFLRGSIPVYGIALPPARPPRFQATKITTQLGHTSGSKEIYVVIAVKEFVW
jgi:hypothetical protein